MPRTEFYLPLLADKPFASSWLLAARVITAAWSMAGPAGLVLLKALCYTGGFCLVADAARWRGVPAHLAALVAGLAASSVAFRLVERPGFFSVLLTGLVMNLVLRATVMPRGRFRQVVLGVIAVIFEAWSFLHAEWYLGWLLVAMLLQDPRFTPGERAATLAGSLALIFCPFLILHPAGAQPLLAPFGFLLGGADFGVREYGLAAWSQMPGAVPLLVAVALLVGGLLQARRYREAALLGILLALTVKIPRAALPTLLIATPWLAASLAALLERSARFRGFASRTPPLPAVALAAALPMVAAALWLAVTPYRTLGFRLDPTLDSRGLGAVLDRVTGREGPILAEFGYTSVLLANPSVVRQGVIMDGRQEAYSADYLQSVYLPCMTGDAAALERAGVAFYGETWRDAPSINLVPGLRARGWELVGYDETGRLLARPGVAARSGLKTYTTDPAHLEVLAGATPEQRRLALLELRDRNVELAAAGLDSAILLTAEGTLALAEGDTDAAREALDKARQHGAERLPNFWRAMTTLATLTNDTDALREATSRLARRPA